MSSIVKKSPAEQSYRRDDDNEDEGNNKTKLATASKGDSAWLLYLPQSLFV